MLYQFILYLCRFLFDLVLTTYVFTVERLRTKTICKTISKTILLLVFKITESLKYILKYKKKLDIFLASMVVLVLFLISYSNIEYKKGQTLKQMV